jgi:hypothetical protein
LNRPLADFDGSLQALRGERILHGSSSFEQDRSESVRLSPGTLLMMPLRRFAPAAALLLTAIGAVPATAQVVVYRPMVPMFAPAAGPFVANYTPAGNYAAVTASLPSKVADCSSTLARQTEVSRARLEITRVTPRTALTSL